MNKICVIGRGKVGIAYIFALVNGNNNVSEIVMLKNVKLDLV